MKSIWLGILMTILLVPLAGCHLYHQGHDYRHGGYYTDRHDDHGRYRHKRHRHDHRRHGDHRRDGDRYDD